MVIHPACSATTARPPAATAARRNHRESNTASPSRSAPYLRRRHAYQPATPIIAVPAASIVWNDQCTMLTGGSSSSGMSSSPMITVSKELPASSEAIAGISIPPRTSPSTRNPPSTTGARDSVSIASSMAASFEGWSVSRRIPATCPITGWSSAPTAANTNGTVNPSRCERSRRPFSIPTAYTEATRKPATTYAATHMWRNCGHSASLNMAASGSTSVTVPSACIVNPAGAFIHEFTARMQNVPTSPAPMIGTRVRRCTRGSSRPQPYR